MHVDASLSGTQTAACSVVPFLPAEIKSETECYTEGKFTISLKEYIILVTVFFACAEQQHKHKNIFKTLKMF